MANFHPPPNTHAYRLYLVKDHKQKSLNFQAPLQSAKPCILAQRFAACLKKFKKIFFRPFANFSNTSAGSFSEASHSTQNFEQLASGEEFFFFPAAEPSDSAHRPPPLRGSGL
jgi:hypothetical protein